MIKKKEMLLDIRKMLIILRNKTEFDDVKKILIKEFGEKYD